MEWGWHWPELQTCCQSAQRVNSGQIARAAESPEWISGCRSTLQRAASAFACYVFKSRRSPFGHFCGLGATPCTEVTILSDGADGPRSLGEAASVGPTCHVLDWFHLAMRIQHVARAVKGWPDVTDEDRQEGARLADAVEHIRWRLWHGDDAPPAIMDLEHARTKEQAKAEVIAFQAVLERDTDFIRAAMRAVAQAALASTGAEVDECSSVNGIARPYPLRYCFDYLFYFGCTQLTRSMRLTNQSDPID